MGNLTIRNVDDRVIKQLKMQAKANQRSLEGEIRRLLTQQVNRLGLPRADTATRLSDGRHGPNRQRRGAA